MVEEDKTEAQQAEEALCESEEHYRSLFNNMLNGFAYCQMHFEQGRPVDFTYLEVNEAFGDLTGLKNVVGKKVSEVIPSIRESDPELFEIYGRVALTGRPERFEIYVESMKMWFSISVYSPQKEHFVALFDEITERKRTEAALIISNKRTIDVMESISDGFFSCDKDMVVTYFNSAAGKLLGRDGSEVLGRKMFDAFPEARGSVFEEKSTEALREGKFISFEAFFEPEPYRNWYEVRVFPYEGGISVYFQVTTERKWTEKSLQATHRFLEIANSHKRMAPLLKAFVAEVKNLVGCEAAGIRILQENGNIPYEAYDGFSQEFYDLENFLSIYVDRCMCINIIKGDTDPQISYYTPGGSFYINRLDEFFCKLSPEERRTLRGNCHKFGYESMALVPIRIGDQILGMVHVADPRKDIMPLPMVLLLEEVGLLLSTALQRVRAEEALQVAHDELELRVEERTADLRWMVEQLQWEIEERQQAEEAMRDSEKKLRNLTSQLLTVQEEERKRLSRELHDSLGQTLLVLKLQIRAIEKTLRPDQQTLKQESEQAMRQIESIVKDVRRLARNLSPSILDDLGLGAALRNLCEEFSRHQDLKLSLDMDDISGSFSPEAQSHIYRIFQESLTNIGKYALARRVSLVIKRREGGVAIFIEDDGIGFQLEEVLALEAVKRAMGLATMTERVRILGGELDITSKPGSGTIISFIVPAASVS